MTVPGTPRFAGQCAVITGGARGIGLGIAQRLAAEGCAIVIWDREPQAFDAARAGFDAAAVIGVDVASETSVRDAAARTLEQVAVDVLVNNAGISGTFAPDTLSTSAWDTLMNVNAKGVFLGMKHAIPRMRAAGGGAIVNISSISGFVGQPMLHMAYNASKGAVRIMTKAAAVQYAPDNIRVNSVHPGVMPAMRTSKVSADPEWRAKMLRAVPMKREGRVEEVAHAVLFLASDEASYITGTELVVDGGYLAM